MAAMATATDMKSALAEAEAAGPAPDGMIAAAEKKLGVAFPADYRQFLSSFGAAAGAGYEIAGVFTGGDPDEPPPFTDVVSFNAGVRKSMRAVLSADYVAVAHDGGEFTFYLDTRKSDARGNCPVVILGPGKDLETYASNFFDFVVRFSQEA
jgi:hypothetical protein